MNSNEDSETYKGVLKGSFLEERYSGLDWNIATDLSGGNKPTEGRRQRSRVGWSYLRKCLGIRGWVRLQRVVWSDASVIRY